MNQIGNVQDRDLANYFKDMEVPASDTRIKKIPNWFVSWLSRKIKQFQSKYPDSPIEIGFPDSLRLLIKSLSMFDPDFARAFVDGRFYDGIDHAKAFEKTKCPILLIHADWKRYENYGLVGAFDDDDAQHAICLAPQIIYKKFMVIMLFMLSSKKSTLNYYQNLEKQYLIILYVMVSDEDVANRVAIMPYM